MNKHLATGMMVLMIAAGAASADVLLYDSFDNYADGLVDGVAGDADVGNYSGNWSGSTSGGIATFASGTLKINRPSGSFSSDYTAVIDLDVSATGNAYYFSGLLTVGSGVDGAIFAVDNDDRSIEIGFDATGHAVANAPRQSYAFTSTGTYTLGQQYLMVAKVEDAANWSGGSDRVTLWIDPVGSEGDNTPVIQEEIDYSGFYPGGPALTDFYFIAGTDDAGDTAVLDDFRIGETFADVVPEPATMALLGIGGLGMLLKRKR